MITSTDGVIPSYLSQSRKERSHSKFIFNLQSLGISKLQSTSLLPGNTVFVFVFSLQYLLCTNIASQIGKCIFQLLQHLGHMQFCENLLRSQWNTWVSTETLLFGKSWTLNSSHQHCSNTFLESFTSTLAHSILVGLADTQWKAYWIVPSPAYQVAS